MILFMQTSDAFKYADMLSYTSKTVKIFCARGGYAYESFVGLRRGFWPWQASFNRIHMLDDLVARGFRGWVVYLDADAYIVDQTFDFDALIKEHAAQAAIMTLSGSPAGWWDINSGVLLFNLEHPVAREILSRWSARFDAVSDDLLRELPDWSDSIDDQGFLQEALRQTPNAQVSISIVSNALINSPTASFIRQFLRALDSNLESRTKSIARQVELLLGFKTTEISESSKPEDIIRMLYDTVFGRDVDDSGLAQYEPIVRLQGDISGTRYVLRAMLDSNEFRQKHG